MASITILENVTDILMFKYWWCGGSRKAQNEIFSVVIGSVV